MLFMDMGSFNTLRPRQNGRHFADDIFKRFQALAQIMAWCRPGDKLLSELMMINLPTAYMRHSASMSQIPLRLKCVSLCNT